MLFYIGVELFGNAPPDHIYKEELRKVAEPDIIQRRGTNHEHWSWVRLNMSQAQRILKVITKDIRTTHLECEPTQCRQRRLAEAEAKNDSGTA